VAIVWPCPLGVEQYAAVGRGVEVPRPDCPGCGRAMGLWSGYARWVRVGGRAWRIWVRRARCPTCRVTHALLPSFALPRRVDVVEVIGRRWSGRSRGWGCARSRLGWGCRIRRCGTGGGGSPVGRGCWRRGWGRWRWRSGGAAGAGRRRAGCGAGRAGGDLGSGERTVGAGCAGPLAAGRVAHRRGLLATTTSPPWPRVWGLGWMPPVPDPS
jgi:Domain of unknown function (DUF6431)